LVIIALGIAWILDGLEVTIVGSVSTVITKSSTLGLSAGEVGLAGSIYVAGGVIGALFFGRLTDLLGRRRLVIWTLGVYTVATALTGLSINFATFGVLRFITGLGIGGEYAAMNSAIDELIPARIRGHVDLAINGSWGIGIAVGAGLSAILLNPALLPVNVGWRLTFLMGVILGLVILYLRRNLPESPRWLMTRGRVDEADQVVARIEQEVQRGVPTAELPHPEGSIRVRERGPASYWEIGRSLFRTYPRRSGLGALLMLAQAFVYNALVFTYVLALTTFYGVSPSTAALFLIFYAIGNVAGPLTIGAGSTRSDRAG
jgi:MFS family permease